MKKAASLWRVLKTVAYQLRRGALIFLVSLSSVVLVAWLVVAFVPKPQGKRTQFSYHLHIGLPPICESMDAGYSFGRTYCAATLFQTARSCCEVTFVYEQGLMRNDRAIELELQWPQPKHSKAIYRSYYYNGFAFAARNGSTVCRFGRTSDRFVERKVQESDLREIRCYETDTQLMKVYLEVPLWAFLLVTGVVPAMFLVVAPIRRWRRRRRGLCVGCGYDLHGNVSGVCSECGLAATDRRLDK